MTIQVKNKLKNTIHILSNLWVKAFLIINIMICLTIGFMFRESLLILLSCLISCIILAIIFALSSFVCTKEKGRFKLEILLNKLRIMQINKSETPTTQIKVKDYLILNNKLFIVYEIKNFDYNSLITKSDQEDIVSKESVLSSFSQFLNELPEDCEFEIKAVKSKAQIPEHFKTLNITIDQYVNLNGYKYYLICKTENKKNIQTILDVMDNSYLSITKLNKQETINLINL